MSQFPYSIRAFRVDTAKLQNRYQQLQRLVHPDFFSQRSQVAWRPPQTLVRRGVGSSGLVVMGLSETEQNSGLHPGTARPQIARPWIDPALALAAFTRLPEELERAR